MARLQLALNVSDLGEAVSFYSRLFGVEPAKLEDGYANFAVPDPPLKLVLFEGDSAVAGSINHLGVEVGTPGEVDAAQARLEGEGLDLAEERGTTCCHALQDKVWAGAPDGLSWEIYTVLEDVPSGASDADACASGACG